MAEDQGVVAVVKKRRLWWFVGGAACFVVLAFVTALLIKTNSPNAELEHALREIISEQGLEYSSKYASYDNGARRNLLADIYTGGPLDQEVKRRIVARLEQACPSCTTEVVIMGDTSPGFTLPFAEPTYDVNYWLTGYESGIRDVTFIFDDRGISTTDDVPSSTLAITRYNDQGPWSFLWSFWPW